MLDLRVADLVVAVSGQWRALLARGVGGALLFILLGFLAPLKYTASAELLPRGGAIGGLAGLGGIAASLGVTVPDARPSESPQFLVSAIRSRVTAQTVIEALTDSASDRVAAIADLALRLGVEDDRPEVLRERLEDAISDRTRARVDVATRRVLLTFVSEDRELSSRILNELISALTAQVLVIATQEARDHRIALEPIATEAMAAVTQEEDRLVAFSLRNRAAGSNPETEVQRARLQRAVTRRDELANGLLRALAEARVSELRSVSPVSVVQPVWVSTLPDSRRLALWGVLGLLLVGGGSVALLGYRVARRPEVVL